MILTTGNTLHHHQRQFEKTVSQLRCKVCLDSVVEIIFLPCSHLVCCVQCAASMSACPVCRSDVRATIQSKLISNCEASRIADNDIWYASRLLSVIFSFSLWDHTAWFFGNNVLVLLINFSKDDTLSLCRVFLQISANNYLIFISRQTILLELLIYFDKFSINTIQIYH